MIPRDNPIPALLEFIGAWVSDLSPRHRIDAGSVPAFVPPPLRAIYEFAGNYPLPHTKQWRRPKWAVGLFGPQDQLPPPDQLQVAGGRFRFIHENQGVWWCETLADEHDPPVFSDCLAWQHGDQGMREMCSRLSHFLTTFCLQELAFGARHLFCVDSEVAGPSELVRQRPSRVWVNGVYAYKEPTHSFYLCDHGLLVMRAHGDFWLAYNAERCASLISNAHDIRRIH
jgi:hypothetical protein